MSLIVSLGVNQLEGVGRIVIRRTHGGAYPDSLNQYEYTIHDDNGHIVRTGWVDHRYGDGAMLLTHLVLKDTYETLDSPRHSL